MEKSTMELENELTRAKNTQDLKALNAENKLNKYCTELWQHLDYI